MKINIQAPWKVNTYLQQVINSKLKKLETFHQHIMHVDVFLKKGGHIGPTDKLAEVRLRTNLDEFFAEAHSDTFEKAITASADKLRRQLLRKKPTTH